MNDARFLPFPHTLPCSLEVVPVGLLGDSIAFVRELGVTCSGDALQTAGDARAVAEAAAPNTALRHNRTCVRHCGVLPYKYGLVAITSHHNAGCACAQGTCATGHLPCCEAQKTAGSAPQRRRPGRAQLKASTPVHPSAEFDNTVPASPGSVPFRTVECAAGIGRVTGRALTLPTLADAPGLVLSLEALCYDTRSHTASVDYIGAIPVGGVCSGT